MRTIRLPDPSGGAAAGVPEIFDRGISCVIRRAVIIGTGAAGAEHQCIGLVRALGLSDSYNLYRVNRPKGSYHYWLRWLPVSLHKKLDCILKHIQADFGMVPPFSHWLKRKRTDVFVENASAIPLAKALPEANPNKIAAIAKAEIDREGPLLVVAAGRDTVSIAEDIKKLAPQATFVVQIQHPRCQLDNFDMIITPLHDYYPLTPAAQQEVPRFLMPFLTPRKPPDKQVVLTTGALHIADSAMLRKAAAAWHDALASLPKPLLIVNIGGPIRNCHYGEDLAVELVSALKRVLASCGSVRISFSRRTPLNIANVCLQELRSYSKIYIWDPRDPNAGPNPHLGHLAWGDAFLITADSVSMLSEACSTGKPVYVIGSERCTWKFRSFHKTLRQKGVVRNFTGVEDMSESWSYPPLNDNVESANRVQAALAEKGWTIGR